MKNLTICVFVIIMPILLFCDNSMEAIAYMEGENEYDKLGDNMTSLDFNGDGFDELVIYSVQWPEGTPSYGKLYFYEGGPDFDAEYDFGLEGTEESSIKYRLDNLGDMNGDGYEELVVSRRADDIPYLEIYFGNDQQELEPDIVYSTEGGYVAYKIRPLGDVNADGFDDAGLIMLTANYEDGPSKFYICYGSDTQIAKELILEGVGTGGIDSMSGVGDVNNDGYDDFTIGYAYYDEYEEERYTNTLYYGGEEIDSEPDVVLWDEPETAMTLGKPAGRFNGDVYDDFVGHFGTNTSTYIWYGQENITDQYDLLLPYGGGGGSLDYAFDHGDVNNDGYDDLAIGYEYAGGNGKAYLYLGGDDPNNVVDLEFTESVNLSDDLFGYSLTMGFFDGDEYADLAVGAPTNWDYSPFHCRGYVFVYGGNGQLYDTANEEEAIPQPPKATLTAHPNPFNPTITFQIKANDYENLQIKIFNAKGQKVKTIKSSEITEASNHQVTWNAQKQASGIYYCILVNVATGQQLAAQKVTLLK